MIDARKHQTTRKLSFAQSVERDAKETREKKKWPSEILISRASRPQDLARQCCFSRGCFFRVLFDGLRERGTTCSLRKYVCHITLYCLQSGSQISINAIRIMQRTTDNLAILDELRTSCLAGRWRPIFGAKLETKNCSYFSLFTI